MSGHSSPRPKSVAAMFLLGAFLTGGVVGYATSRTLGSSGSTVPATPALMREVIKQTLKLSPEQGAKLDAAYAERRAAFDSIRAIDQAALDSIRGIHQPALDSVRVANHAKVMQFLDSTQQTAYREMIEKDKKRADSVRKAGGQK